LAPKQFIALIVSWVPWCQTQACTLLPLFDSDVAEQVSALDHLARLVEQERVTWLPRGTSL
jgi:hypothetical protein